MPQGKTYVKIASQTLGSAAATITFNNIPQNYTDLVVVMNGTCSTSDYNLLQFNSDSGSNYSHTEFYGDGSSAGYGRGSSRTTMYVGRGDASRDIKTLNIMNYSNGSTYKTMIYRNNSDSVGVFSGLWKSTASITSLTFSRGAGNYNSGYSITIYGIEAAKSPKAEGGDKVYSTGTHWVHEFYYSGTFVPRQNLTADYLVVAGGGGGGKNWAGGGGAGGYRYFTSQSLAASTNYAVAVGAGGAGAVTITAQNAGNNSSFGSTSATGGGAGGNNKANPTSGGSGGGGAYTSEAGISTNGAAGNAGSYSPVEGYAGGSGYNGSTRNSSAGGGGSSAVGANAVNDAAGAGGAGTSNSITGSAVTYAGGGGGGGYSPTGTYPAGAGGSGGGGAGGQGVTVSGTAGTANTGGGGGGGSGADGNGGAGGSGIVIVRYAV